MRSRQRWVLPILFSVLFASTGHGQQGANDRSRSIGTAQQLVEAAAAALGGRDRILAVKTLTIEAYGTNPNIGQGMTPEAEPLFWMLPDYTRTIDLEHGRMELAMTLRPAFPAVFDARRQAQRLDGDVAYDIAAGLAFGAPRATGTGPAPLPASVVRDRRIDMLQHPLTLLRAALQPNAQVSNLRAVKSGHAVDITTADGDRLTLTVDVSNRPRSVTTAVYHANLGDTTRVTAFDAYENLNGLLLPKRLRTTLDRWTEYELGVMKNTLDAEVDLAAPAAVRNAARPATAPPAALQMEAVAPGIWFGGGSAIVEFADHVTLVEVHNEARVAALLSRARELVPGKAVTHAVISHHHFDHAAGLRAAVAQGLTIVTHRINAAWFREAVARKHTIVADALAKSPKPLKMIVVDDSLTMKDASMEMALYHVRGATHADSLVMAYFPKAGFLIEPDQTHGTIMPHIRGLYSDIQVRGLKVERIADTHAGTPLTSWQSFEKMYADWCCKTRTTTSYVPVTR